MLTGLLFSWFLYSLAMETWVSLFCFDLVLNLNKAKADLYNYELEVWKIIRNADLKYDSTPFIESKDTCHL